MCQLSGIRGPKVTNGQSCCATLTRDGVQTALCEPERAIDAKESSMTLRRWSVGLILGVVVAGCFSSQAQTSAPTFEPTATPSELASPSSIATESPSAGSTESTSPSAPPSASPSAACLPTDQDADVYHPARLVVITACLRVTGTVYSIKTEADGDLHI